MTKRIIINITIGALLLAALAYVSNRKPSPVAASSQHKIDVIPVPQANGWGYKIAVDGKTFIYQDRIPAVEGNVAFTTKTAAIQTGTLVVQKLMRSESPRISTAELDSMQIVKNR
ncbi:uncharacterized protein DUF4907 [Chitinophaga skermanii]|uniref:Uncharacterized protein DUF4907 n=1 Tax=Chitinophaga skermanii TaxID=331697 RepID=A0A327QEA1_9BACT|nr:DUF4907 domain-containing protein [Chitinophaga skermanii]RAJ02631.1 uncharacterized protein DUF4907 [Chitinophaga skermanii]